MHVRTPRLELRPYALKDYKNWLIGCKSVRPKKNRFDLGVLTKQQMGLANFQKILRRQAKRVKDDRGYCLGIFDRETQVFMGWVDFFVHDRGDTQSANFGYALLNPFRRKGYGTEATSAALWVGFKHLKLQRLEASILPANLPSRRLAEKIGFKFECRRRRCDWEQGRWQDKLIYSATPEDFGLESQAPSVGLFL